LRFENGFGLSVLLVQESISMNFAFKLLNPDGTEFKNVNSYKIKAKLDHIPYDWRTYTLGKEKDIVEFFEEIHEYLLTC